MKEEKIKSSIFYSRTYRHLKPNYKNMVTFYLLFALPLLILLVITNSRLTKIFSEWGRELLLAVIPKAELGVNSSDLIPLFGKVFFITLPNKIPSYNHVMISLIVTLVLLVVCFRVKDRAKPIATYAAMGLLIHFTTCIFFLVMPESFPYTITQYSDLYMKQQVGIWLSFLIIASLVSGGITYSGFSKFTMVIAVMGYSILFGFLRYIVYLVILYKASTLYMPILFFAFGPFYDFLYLVCIYSIYMNVITKKFVDNKGDIEWEWA